MLTTRVKRKIEDVKMDWLCKCYGRVISLVTTTMFEESRKREKNLIKVTKCCA